MLWRNWSVNDGANVALLDSPYGGDLPADIEEKLHPGRWYADHVNVEGIDRLIDLAARNQVHVYWLLPPISPGLQQRREQSGSEAKYEGFVRSYQQRFPAVVSVLDGRRIARDPSLYVDATHLSGRGAVVLSRAVGGVLGQDAGWIELQEPPAAAFPPLEDVEQSRKIVRAAGD